MSWHTTGKAKAVQGEEGRGETVSVSLWQTTMLRKGCPLQAREGVLFCQVGIHPSSSLTQIFIAL